MIGLFRELEPKSDAQLPRLSDLAGTLPTELVEPVSAYLDNGAVVLDVMEMVRDPMDPSIGLPGGSGVATDGRWVWRLDLSYFVRRYRVGLPADFLNGMDPNHNTVVTRELCADARKARERALKGL